MWHIYEIKKARKAAKVSQTSAAKAIGKHFESVKRLEEGDILQTIDTLAKYYNCHVCILNQQESRILGQILAILGENGEKMRE
jgi:transcriptional regulator with XRE-family HTH domain